MHQWRQQKIKMQRTPGRSGNPMPGLALRCIPAPVLYLAHCCLFLIATQVGAFTNVSGTINADTTWDLVGSPFVLNGNVFVAEGVTLTLSPGWWSRGRVMRCSKPSDMRHIVGANHQWH